MLDTVHNKKKLLHRIRRIRGQVDAVEQALRDDRDCSTVLMTLAAGRGAINSLMSEVLEGHLRFHVLASDRRPTAAQKAAAEDLLQLIRAYLK